VPRACILCTHRDQRAVQAAFREGLSDRAIGRKFGLTHPSVANHRREHLLKPLAVATAVPEVREARKQQLAATEQGVEAQLAIIASVGEMLSRVGEAAENSGQITAVTQVAEKQLRRVEVASRLLQLGGYAVTPRAVGEAAEAPRWTIQMVFPNAGRSETMTIMGTPSQSARLDINVPEADATDGGDPDPNLPPSHGGPRSPPSPGHAADAIGSVFNDGARSAKVVQSAPR
jgi:hypothetical protein